MSSGSMCRIRILGAIRELLLQRLGFWADRILPFAVAVMPDDVGVCEFALPFNRPSKSSALSRSTQSRTIYNPRAGPHWAAS